MISSFLLISGSYTTKARATLQIITDARHVTDKFAFVGPNALCVAVEPDVMLGAMWNFRKRMQRGTDLFPPTNDPVNVRHRAMDVP
jgi:uncharacterized membrane protein YjjP (DUF1212 family)